MMKFVYLFLIISLPFMIACGGNENREEREAAESAEEIGEEELELIRKNLQLVEEAEKLATEPPARFATPNEIRLDLSTMRLREYAKGDARGAATLVDAPYAGHSAVMSVSGSVSSTSAAKPSPSRSASAPATPARVPATTSVSRARRAKRVRIMIRSFL